MYKLCYMIFNPFKNTISIAIGENIFTKNKNPDQNILLNLPLLVNCFFMIFLSIKYPTNNEINRPPSGSKMLAER